MHAPRPRDFLRAELVRLSHARSDALRRHIGSDAALRGAIRRMYDRRIEDLLEQLVDARRVEGPGCD